MIDSIACCIRYVYSIVCLIVVIKLAIYSHVISYICSSKSAWTTREAVIFRHVLFSQSVLNVFRWKRGYTASRKRRKKGLTNLSIDTSLGVISLYTLRIDSRLPLA